ncbi:MAG TPA: hypothetical protein VHZ28_06520 [Terracidiphilus sp.]|nr:hypothetical protein [Terracidiphilus sp.]
MGILTGCLTKLILITLAALVLVWLFTVALNPWALHMGGRSTPLLYWHGMGILRAKDGREYPFYVTFYPGKPQGFHGGGRREGKIVAAHLGGAAWLCLEPGSIERMDLTGTMYGGYASDAQSLLDFRVIEWRKPFSTNSPNRGFFDMAGTWHNGQLVMDRPGEQGIRLKTGPFIDNATVTLQWASYEQFKWACRDSRTEDR